MTMTRHTPVRTAGILGLAAMMATLGTQIGLASDYFHVCRTADGGFEMNDEALYKVNSSQEPNEAIPYRKLAEKTLRRETGYCTVTSAGNRRFNYESRTYTLRLAFQDEGRAMEADFICEYASDGLPAAYTCDRQVVVSREGTAADAFAPPSPGGASLWLHNGSLTRLEASGTERKFYYETPRSGMLKAGARSGTLLFEGTREEAIYSGVAYIFVKGCEPAPYAVSGKVSDDDRRITMTGEAPRLDKSCKVVGKKPDTLVFTYRQDLKR